MVIILIQIVCFLSLCVVEITAQEEDAQAIQCLLEAAFRGDIVEVQDLLEYNGNGVSVDVQSSSGETALNIAVREGHMELASYLVLDAGADCSLCTNNGISPFLRAAEKGFVTFLPLLLPDEDGAIDEKTSSGVSALLLASRANQYAAVEWLLIHGGADNASAAPDDWQALHFAIKNGNTEMVELLIHDGAPVEAETKDMWLPLHLAAKYGFTDIVVSLIRHGEARIDARSRRGGTAALFAAANNQLETLSWLIEEKNGLIHDVLPGGWTPLHFAAKNGNAQMVAFLVSKGANLNACTGRDWTPLHVTARYGHNQLIRTLIAYGTSEVLRTTEGLTAEEIFEYYNTPEKVAHLELLELHMRKDI